MAPAAELALKQDHQTAIGRTAHTKPQRVEELCALEIAWNSSCGWQSCRHTPWCRNSPNLPMVQRNVPAIVRSPLHASRRLRLDYWLTANRPRCATQDQLSVGEREGMPIVVPSTEAKLRLTCAEVA